MSELPFDGDSGLVLITGENGHGKTSIEEALEFSIYGKSTRVATKDLANWFNDNGYTEVEFDTSDGRSVKVCRGIAPEFYDLEVMSGDGSKIRENKKENKANKVKVDQMVEDELFGIPHEVFSNNILLSIHDFKSFIKMKSADKRKIIDKIFQTDVFNDMNELLKKDLKEYRDKLMVQDSLYNSKKSSLDSIIARINELKSTIDDGIDNKIDSLKNDLLSLSQGLINKDAEYTSITTQLASLNKELTEYLSKVSGVESMVMTEYNTLVSNITYSDKATRNSVVSSMVGKRDAGVKELNDTLSAYIASLGDVMSGVKQTVSVLQSEIDVLTASINTEKANHDKMLNYSLESLKATHDSNMKLLHDKYKLDLGVINDKILSNSLEVNRLNAEMKVGSDEYISVSSALSVLKNKLSLYDNDKCVSCGVDLKHTEFHVKEHEKLVNDVASTESKLAYITSTCNALSESLKTFNVNAMSLSNELRDLDTKCNNDSNTLLIIYNGDVSSERNRVGTLLNNRVNEINNEISRRKTDIIAAESAAKTRYDGLVNTEREKCTSGINKLYSDHDAFLSGYNASCDAELNNKLSAARSDMDAKMAAINAKSESKITSLNTSIEYSGSMLQVVESGRKVIRDSINECNVKIAELSNGDILKSISELESMANVYESEISVLYADKLVLEGQVKKCEDTQFLIGENGLKRLIMNKVIPSFNATIQQITSMFDFKYRFMFDNNFDVELYYCGRQIPITVSRGEGSIMDIIVILATLQIILMKHQNINVLFLDEIFSNLDVNNIAKAVAILKEYSRKYNLTIFVMSHTQVPYELFDKIIDVKNDGNFSTLCVR
jgi:DNA repair exonuclease SbcCD ATPase subunit